MAGFGSFAALLPEFRVLWGMSNAGAGWVEGAFQAGYLAGVPLLVGLTDRIDARRIYLGSMAITAIAAFAFAFLAEGLWSACLLRAAAGLGLAGTYMPGLRMLSDRVSGPRQSRAVAFYTASFSVGASVSVLMAGSMAEWLGWRWAFAAAGAGACLALVLVALAVAPRPRLPAAAPSSRPGAPRRTGVGRLLDFRPVLANRRALGYSLAYGAHMWELFGFRAWIVAFLLFAQGQGQGGGGLPSATGAAAFILVLALPASILGNEACLRFGRRRVLAVVMLGSALIASLVGLSAALPLALTIAVCAVYGVTVGADSASLTAGAVAAARPGQQGLTMAFHSLVGFAAAAISPLAFGTVLDLGGDRNLASWWIGFAVLGLGVALGPAFLWWASRGGPPETFRPAS